MNQNTETKTDAFVDGVVTVEQAIGLTALSRSTIYSLVRDGQVTASKVGRRRLLSRSDLLALLRAGATTPTTSASAASPEPPTSTTGSDVDKETP